MANSDQSPSDAQALLGGASAAARAALERWGPLERRAAELWAQAAEGGELGVSRADFLREAGARLPDADPCGALGDLRGRDLYVAIAAAREAGAAVALVRGQVSQLVAAEARRLRIPESADEAEGIVLELLFVRGTERPAAIAQYSGRGELAGWLRVIAVRELLRLKKRAAARAEVDGELPELLAPGDDPELGYLRGHYRGEFRQAVRDALSALPERDRTVLKQHLIDGLTIDELGALYGVHRATAARWILRAQEKVAEQTRSLLHERLDVDPEELASILRLVRSNLEVSLRGLLKP